MAEWTTTAEADDEALTPEAKSTRDRHTKAMQRFKYSASFFSEQRKREMDDLKFIDFGEQWNPTAKAQRAGNQTVAGLPPTPPRPAITINQLRGPCQQVASQRRNARLALTFSPTGGGTRQELAEIFDDVVRAIQQESRASVARNWAADRAEKAGMGWYRIDTEYSLENPTDPSDPAWNDQDIVFRRILNQASVYPDPHAQEPDFSDGKCLFLTQDMSWDEYKAQYPESKMAAMDDGELSAIGDTSDSWVFTSSEVDTDTAKTVRIAEYWEVVERRRRRVELETGTTAFEDELPEGATPKAGGRTRWVIDRTLYWSKMNAVEFLEGPVEWNGLYIPIVPCIGDEANIDGERRWTGIVAPGKEAATSYNVMRSAQIEAVGLATKAPYIGFMETIEPYLEWWKNANTRNFPMLPVKAARGPDGAVLPMPQRNVMEPAIQAITLAAAAARDDVHTTTGVPPVALGQIDPHERSGKAIQALQQQSEIGSSGYLDNLVSISMAYEGKVLRDLIPRIYDRPGRIVPAVSVDESSRLVMLNAPYVDGPDGQPQPLPHWREGMPLPQGAKYYRLADAKLSVTATVGKAYATRRKESSEAIGNVLQVVPPEMAAAMTPAWLEEQDYPGARKIAKIAVKALPPPLAAIYDEDDPSGQAVPPQAKAMIRQLQMQLQQAQQIINGEQVKQQSETDRELRKAQMDAQMTIQKAQIDAETRIAVARINAQAGLTEAEIKAGSAEAGHQVAREEQMIGNDHELRVQAIDHAHEREMAERQADQQREAQQAASVEAERDRQYDAAAAANQETA